MGPIPVDRRKEETDERGGGVSPLRHPVRNKDGDALGKKGRKQCREEQ